MIKVSLRSSKDMIEDILYLPHDKDSATRYDAKAETTQGQY